MKTVILHLQVPENFVEICMKEWDGDKPISKLKIAELYEKYITYSIGLYFNQMDYEEFITSEFSNQQTNIR
jgi:hypothetical protein